MTLTRAEVAAFLDHTLLRPEATDAEVVALCEEANRLRVAAVCVSPSRLPLLAGRLASGIGVACVVGFPSGAHHGAIKAAEAALASGHGAGEIDMVIDLGRAKAGDWAGVGAEISAVRNVLPSTVLLKVIIESGVLTDDEIIAACRASEASGAQYVKTSTGFHPAGGATIAAVELMAETVGGRLGVKASGGIRTAEDAAAMIRAGATRIGTSSSAAILAGFPE